jgi:hypothetical protein
MNQQVNFDTLERLANDHKTNTRRKKINTRSLVLFKNLQITKEQTQEEKK